VAPWVLFLSDALAQRNPRSALRQEMADYARRISTQFHDGPRINCISRSGDSFGAQDMLGLRHDAVFFGVSRAGRRHPVA
jgi:hypothetical protein